MPSDAAAGPASRDIVIEILRYRSPCKLATNVSIATTERKFAGVMSASGMVNPNSASTASIRFTISSDEIPLSRKSSSAVTGFVIARRARRSCTSATTLSLGVGMVLLSIAVRSMILTPISN